MKSDRFSPWKRYEILFIAIYAIIASYFNLSGFPEHFKDESWFITVLIREYSTGGNAFTHVDAPIASSGPILFVPILLLVNTYPSTIFITRIIPATYFLGSIILYHQILRKCEIEPILRISSTILYVSFYSTLGRRFLGEVPAIFFVLWAILLILVWKSEEIIQNFNRKHLVVIGILFGFAFTIKEISGLFFGIFFLYHLNLSSVINDIKTKNFDVKRYYHSIILGISFILPTIVELVWMVSVLGISGTLEFFGSSSLYDRHIGLKYAFFASYDNLVMKLTVGQFFMWIPIFALIVGYYYFRSDEKNWFFDYNNYIIFGYTLYYLILDIGWIRHYSLTIVAIFFSLTIMINQGIMSQRDDKFKAFLPIILLLSQFTILLVGQSLLFFSPLLLFGICFIGSLIILLEFYQRVQILDRFVSHGIKKQIIGGLILAFILPSLTISGVSVHSGIITDERNSSSIETYSFINAQLPENSTGYGYDRDIKYELEAYTRIEVHEIDTCEQIDTSNSYLIIKNNKYENTCSSNLLFTAEDNYNSYKIYEIN